MVVCDGTLPGLEAATVDALHSFLALVLLVVVMKWYCCAQMRYWSSSETDCEPENGEDTYSEKPERAAAKHHRLRFL